MRNKRNKKNKYKGAEDSKNSIVKIFLEYTFSDNLLNNSSQFIKSIMPQYSILRTLMRKLVKIRNKILWCLKKLHEVRFSDFLLNFEKEDHVKLIEIVNRIKDEKLFDLCSLWSIKRKTTAHDEYKDAELTE